MDPLKAYHLVTSFVFLFDLLYLKQAHLHSINTNFPRALTMVVSLAAPAQFARGLIRGGAVAGFEQKGQGAAGKWLVDKGPSIHAALDAARPGLGVVAGQRQHVCGVLFQAAVQDQGVAEGPGQTWPR